MLELKTVKIDPPKDCNTIVGMAHFIKTAEDLYEASGKFCSKHPIRLGLL